MNDDSLPVDGAPPTKKSKTEPFADLRDAAPSTAQPQTSYSCSEELSKLRLCLSCQPTAAHFSSGKHKQRSSPSSQEWHEGYVSCVRVCQQARLSQNGTFRLLATRSLSLGRGCLKKNCIVHRTGSLGGGAIWFCVDVQWRLYQM